VAVGVQWAQPEFTAIDRVEWFLAAVGVGGIALLCNRSDNSRVVLRRWSWGWFTATVLLFHIDGFGLVFLPLAIGYRIASRHGRVAAPTT